MVVSLAGVAASQRVTEAYEGKLKINEIYPFSVMA